MQDLKTINHLRRLEIHYFFQQIQTEIEADYLIHQGFTEQSNVQVVSEMVDLIAITRAYEANQKVIQTIDGSLELAANSVGKV